MVAIVSTTIPLGNFMIHTSKAQIIHNLEYRIREALDEALYYKFPCMEYIQSCVEKYRTLYCPVGVDISITAMEVINNSYGHPQYRIDFTLGDITLGYHSLLFEYSIVGNIRRIRESLNYSNVISVERTIEQKNASLKEYLTP
jgi:hypothetical protein